MTQAAVLEDVRIGIEATPYTPVAATDILAATSVEFDFDANIEAFGPMGYKTDTGMIFNSERSRFNIRGKPTFHELVYWLNTLVDGDTITTPGGATNARNHQFIPDPTDADDVETMTIEKAGVDRSYEVAGCQLNQLTFTLRRSPGGSSIEVTGQGFGQPITDGITPTGSLSQLAFVPMVPNMFDLFIDDSAANLGNTGFTDSFEFVWTYGPKFRQFESIDSSEASFSGVYEVKTPSTVQVRFERSAAASGLITQMRAGSPRFIRLKGTGATDAIESGQTWDFQLDFCGGIVTPTLGNQDDLSTIGYTFANLNDPTWGQSMQIDIVNDLAAL